jgi:uncharacterized repeat protein (TIGR03803 family)
MSIDHFTVRRASRRLSSCGLRMSATWLAGFALMVFGGIANAAAPHVGEISMLGTSGSNANGLQRTPLSVIVGSNGNLYGIAAAGGSSNKGGLFSVTPAGVVTDIYDMGISDGTWYAFPFQYLGDANTPKLGQLSNDTLYFSTPTGGPFTANTQTGPSPYGNVSTFSTSGVLTNLHTFYGTSVGDAENPYGVQLGPDGNFYGFTGGYSPITTTSGNTSTTLISTSVIYQVTPGGTESLVYVSTDSLAPTSFIVGSDGNFYGSLLDGTTVYPSMVLPGDTLFQVTPQGIRTLLYTLSESDGSNISSLMRDPQGDLIGITTSGGQYNDGTIFEYSAQGQFSILHSFNPQAEEGTGAGSLMIGADDNLYGVTSGGGVANSGTLFRLSPDGVYTTLIYFSGSNGEGGGMTPNSLVQGAGRFFYGATSAGGKNQSGLIFQLIVPIVDDYVGSGVSSVISFGPEALTTVSPIGNGQAMMTAIAQGYYPAAVGDFNGDGIADVLWTSAKNDLYIWFGSTQGFVPKYLGTLNSGWQVVGAGDMNDDGIDDIVFINPSQHLISYQLMDGLNPSPGYKTVSYAAGYYPVAIGDFNGDGYADIVWTSAKNDMYIWFSGPGDTFTSKYITTFPAGWTLEGRGDLDGNGASDLVWLNAAGTEWGYWLMSNSGTVLQVVTQPVPAQLQGYHITTVADYNGDGRADILWTNGYNLALMTNQGTPCSNGGGCTFTTSAPSFTIPAGQTIFNSGIPTSKPAWAN